MHKAQTGSKGCEQGDEEGAAARQFQVKFLVDGNVLQIGAGLEKKEDQYVIHLEAEPEPTVTITEE